MISAKDFFFFYYCKYRGCLDFQLPMESVLITTNVVSPILAILFKTFGILAPKTLIYLTFQSFDFKRT
jgi:hypothetical protein